MFLHILVPSFAFQIHFEKKLKISHGLGGRGPKNRLPLDESRHKFFSGSGDLIESFGGGISFTSITLFFDIICLA